jgi:hypothetical protein
MTDGSEFTGTITQAELASRLGISRQAVCCAKREGRLGMDESGRRVDLDSEATKYYVARALERLADKGGKVEAAEALAQRRRAVDAQRKKPPPVEKSEPKKKKKKAVKKGRSLEELRDLDKHELDKLKTISIILEKQQKTEIVRRELVERESVAALFSRLYTIHISEFHGLGGKIAADVAAHFKLDDAKSKIATKKIIDDNVFHALKHIQAKITRHLEELKKSKKKNV